jgi:2,4-dienoyl-CoA reductase-like NADH-dependent reductase (Old Yellow Enzyme family)
MVDLFDTTSIKGMTLNNRFVRSGTQSFMCADDGVVTPKETDLMRNVAKGGVGLLVTGYAYVLKDGQAALRQLGIYSDAMLPGLTQMVSAVHEAGGKVAVQIVHGGAHSVKEATGVEPMGPSAIPPVEGKMGGFTGCRAMTQNDIDTAVEGFRQAAVRAKKAGFDAIQLHGAHGYLFSQFLSPFYNKRTDRYGGSVENRARIVIEAYEKVRKEVGDDYPVMIKMNATDFLDDAGISRDEAVQAASIYSEAGINAIELSGGTGWGLSVLGDLNRTAFRTVRDEGGYYRDIAKILKQKVRAPIILTGGLRSYDVAEQIVRDGIADYIGLCRPLIRESGLVNRWKSGNTSRSGCVSDNGCVFAALGGKDLECVQLAEKKNT